MAASDAFRLMRGVSGRVSSALSSVGLLGPRHGGQAADPQKKLNRGTKEAGDADVLDSRRLDAALERLRAASQSPEDLE